VSPSIGWYQIILLGDRHVHVTSLPKAVIWKWTGWGSNLRPFGSQVANALIIMPHRPLWHCSLWAVPLYGSGSKQLQSYNVANIAYFSSCSSTITVEGQWVCRQESTKKSCFTTLT